MSVLEILNGYKNYFLKNEVVEETAKKRAEICTSCEFSEKGIHSAVLPDVTLGEVEGFYCSVCFCPLSVKVRSKSNKCPKSKW